jgi:hypothetical protein
MGRLFFLVLLVGTAWFTLNVIGVSVGLGGVGTQISAQGVVREAGQLEARFRTVGALDETYMLFGGDVQRDRNSLVHVTAAGLPILVARAIAAVHPDFHRCKSPGAPQAMSQTKNLGLVAADRAALSTLADALDLFEERLASDGERTCIRVTGAPLALESVTVPEHGADITRDVAGALRQTELVLAQSVQIQDCQTLLR